MKKFFLLVPGLIVTALLSGCYTQFVMVDRTPPPEQISYVVDSATGDTTVKVIKQTDTVQTRDHQTCIWQRDLMGYPRLHCYDSFYPRDWLYYNYSPWWYDEYPYYSGGSYYGGRRHYTHSYYEQGDGRSRAPSTNDASGPIGPSKNPRVRGISDPQPDGSRVNSGNTISTGTHNNIQGTSSSGSGIIVIQPEGTTPPRIINDRGRGLSSGSGTPSPVANNPPPSSGSTSATVNQAPPPQSQPPAYSNPQPPRQSAPSENNSHPDRRRTRGL